MTATPPLVRASAVAAPILLFLYGLLRLLDGLDGHHDKTGLAWRLGHSLFFIAFLLLGAMTVLLRDLVPARSGWQRTVATVAAALGASGAACFLWVILGDLFAGFPDLPDALQVVGPALFQVGVLTLLVQLVVARRLPIWSPVLMLVGFAAIGVNLDLIPLAALVVLAGLAPLAVTGRPGGLLRRRSSSRTPHTR